MSTPATGYAETTIWFQEQELPVEIVMQRIQAYVEGQRKNSLNLRPQFRRPDLALWGKSQASQFVESLLIRLPMPTFYLNTDEQHENLWEVVDGSRRLQALYTFWRGEFPLQDLTFLPDLNMKTFATLPFLYQRRFLETKLRFYIIEKAVPLQARWQLFRRINGGNIQEPDSTQEMKAILDHA